MTYHMEKNMGLKQRISPDVYTELSRIDGKLALQFPWKLWHAVSSSVDLVSWNETGNGIVVNANDFESQVMTTYPGLVEISTFANFRRQMREYGFNWIQCRATGDFSFSHPCFLRDRKDLLHLVITRRRSKKADRGEKSSVQRKKFNSDNPVKSKAVRIPSINWGPNTKRGNRKTKVALERATSQQSFHQSVLFTTPSFKTKKSGQIRLRPINHDPTEYSEASNDDTMTSRFNFALIPASTGIALGERLAFEREIGETNRQDENEEAWWNDCFPWVLQQDPDLCRQFEIENLTASLDERSQRMGGIPLHFYPDEFQEATSHYDIPLPWFSPIANDLIEAKVIEIKPISDDSDIFESF